MRWLALASLAAAIVVCGGWQQQQTPAAKPATPPAAAPGKLAPGDYATFDTAGGKFVVQLYKKEAPLTVQNFENLAQGKKTYRDPLSGTLATNKFYDGLFFFRTVSDYLIQTGDVLNTGQGSIGYTIKDEKDGLKFDRPGRMGMAQVEGQPGSRSSQIFFTFKPNPALDADFLVMGQIVDGLDIAQALSRESKPRINHVTIQVIP